MDETINVTVNDSQELVEVNTSSGNFGNVSAPNNLEDNKLIKGDGNGKDIQKTGINVDDNENISGARSLHLESLTDADVYDFLRFKAGDTDTYRRYMEWLSYNDVRTNLFGVNAQNLFILFDSINAYHILTGGNNGDTQLNAGGTGKVFINHEASNPNVGSGGLEVRGGNGTNDTSNRIFATSNNGTFIWNAKGLKAYHSNNSDYFELGVFSNGQAYLVSTLSQKYKSNDNIFAWVNASYVEQMRLEDGVLSIEGGIDKGVTETTDTSTTINLGNILGNYCNMASANSNTSFTITGAVTGGKAKVLINSLSEPTVIGATKIKGSTFAVSTNMYLCLEDNGNRIEYWFEEI